jgi:hypothetical protein
MTAPLASWSDRNETSERWENTLMRPSLMRPSDMRPSERTEWRPSERPPSLMMLLRRPSDWTDRRPPEPWLRRSKSAAADLSKPRILSQSGSGITTPFRYLAKDTAREEGRGGETTCAPFPARPGCIAPAQHPQCVWIRCGMRAARRAEISAADPTCAGT